MATTSSNPENSGNIATSLSQSLVDIVSRNILALLRLFEFKARLVRFLASLYTTENLLLLRNLLEYGVSFGRTALQFLPTSTESGAWLEAFFQGIINLNILGLNNPAENNIEEPKEPAPVTSENDAPPPPIYHQNEPETNNLANTVRETRHISEEDKELLEKHENQLVSLDKLINAGRYVS
ncbi:uncharacterized protein LOC143192410 [Rhynchophorus ferrugineus]|uniref:uncharacterized protein LOC143192410 n=1 Tax=Rhynchophorus ferrugineus TaxID=354439 RepID=UPI003FCCD49A